jgi:hypothetical protein
MTEPCVHPYWALDMREGIKCTVCRKELEAPIQRDQLPSKERDILAELRALPGAYRLLGYTAAEEIETLRRKLDTCGLECSEGLNRLAAENERLRACLSSIQGCGSCAMCSGAAQRALGEPIERELAAKMVARCEHGNPIDPTGGYVCLKCFNTAKPTTTSGSTLPPGPEWHCQCGWPNDADRDRCGGCEAARPWCPSCTKPYAECRCKQPPVVCGVDCPACGKPMEQHTGEMKPGGVLWCP